MSEIDHDAFGGLAQELLHLGVIWRDLAQLVQVFDIGHALSEGHIAYRGDGPVWPMIEYFAGRGFFPHAVYQTGDSLLQ